MALLSPESQYFLKQTYPGFEPRRLGALSFRFFPTYLILPIPFFRAAKPPLFWWTKASGTHSTCLLQTNTPQQVSDYSTYVQLPSSQISLVSSVTVHLNAQKLSASQSHLDTLTRAASHPLENFYISFLSLNMIYFHWTALNEYQLIEKHEDLPC